ncbi:MAG: SDR family NAD(P)-dependent oxidoreductase [Chloroflexota bacterium]
MTTSKRHYGNWALVTGAARERGLGYAFAKQLAVSGINVIMVDILETQLAQRAKELRETYKVQARAITLDLANPDFMRSLLQQIDDIQIDLLICNHMFTPLDTPKILDMDLEVHHRMLDINARAYVTLLHTFGRQMRERKRGNIIIIASWAGFIPAPYGGAYSANKAFQIAMGEVLWYELKGTGVDVTVVAAGLMNTQGDALSRYPKFLVADTADVVAETLNRLGKTHLVVPGLINKLFVFVQMRLMGRRQTINNTGIFIEKGFGKSRGPG